MGRRKMQVVGLAMSRQSEGVAPGHGKAEAPKDGRIVTQAEIKTICDAEAEAKRLRAEMEAKIREGWKVEPGAYFAQIESTMNKQSCSKKFLINELGEETAQTIWNKLGQNPGERFKYGILADKGPAVEG